MGIISAEDIKHEPVPPEGMIEVDGSFHDDNVASFIGFDRGVVGKGRGLDFLRDIAVEIMTRYENIVWVSFSPKAIEFGIKNPTLEEAQETIASVFYLLDLRGYKPKREGITFRS